MTGIPLAHRRIALTLGGILIVAALIQGWSYWPGIITWDAINQYGQALTGEYDDWHPPAMAWVWRRLIALHPGPGPMFLLQMALYWTGAALIVGGALRQGRPRAAIGLLIMMLLPFPMALMGSVLKDCLMQGLMLTGVGLFVWSGPERRWPVRIAGMAALLLAGLLRFNAFFATLPLILAFLPAEWRRTPARLALSTLVALACLVAAMPLANKAIGADHSDVELSLMIFDLGGITRNSGVNQFPILGLPDPVAENARCYNPEKWDYYSSWSTRPCGINFNNIDPLLADHKISPYPAILNAALHHPIAYAEHRLAHFNINSRFLVHDEVQGAAPDDDNDNDWGFTIARNAGLRTINAITAVSIHSPLGWPIVWMTLAAGLLGIAPLLPSRAIMAPIALSALLYGLGYLPFSVSSELRYNLWTITGAGMALAFAVEDFAAGTRVSRARLAICFAPAVVVALLCLIWRLT